LFAIDLFSAPESILIDRGFRALIILVLTRRLVIDRTMF